jgi:hypothetical protein
MVFTVKYEGNIPKNLRAWCDKHPERVTEVSQGGGYNTDSGMAYDVLLRRHWGRSDGDGHTIIESTAKDTLAELRAAKPCTCEDCVTGRGW